MSSQEFRSSATGTPPAGMSAHGKDRVRGYSLIELIISLLITLVILGVAVAAFSSALGRRERETSRTDAITAAQAALNIMSREIGNSGYGLTSNGIVVNNSNDKQLHFRANISNSNYGTTEPGEDVIFYFDQESQSVVRYDANVPAGTRTSGIINRVSDVDFVYHNYNSNGTFTSGPAPSETTGRVTIKLKVILSNVRGQPVNQTVTVSSDVTLRNSPYMLGQY